MRGPLRLVDGSERIVHAVRPALQRLVERHDLAQRRERLLRTLRDGKLGLDVLREPLFPYQERGVAHLVAGGRALLADDMGLGKTVQAIAACETLRRQGEAERVLIVTPASLKAQWASEIARYAGRHAVVVAGNAAQRRASLLSDAPYTVVNYEVLWRDPELAREAAPDVIVLDEAQRAKNFRTKTAALLRRLESRFCFVLTGTPVENRLDDLYSLMQVVAPEAFGPLWRFNLDFHVQTSRTRRSGYRNLGALRERIAPFVLRRKKEEVLSQLPPLVEQTRYVPLGQRQAEIEAGLRTDAAPLMATAQRRALTPEEQRRLMMLLLKARQTCNAVELYDPALAGEGCGKLDELEQLVTEVVEQGGAKLLVFSEWTEMLKLAGARLEKLGVGYAFLHGGVPTEKRPALLERFREDGEARVLLSTDAGGVGLNLQVASYVVHLDLPWNPGRLDQRTARAHRLGQTRGVSVTYLCAETGIERGIESTLAGKRRIRSAALDPTSDVEALEVPTFTAMIGELHKALAAADAVVDDGAVAEADEGEAHVDGSEAGDASRLAVPDASRLAAPDASRLAVPDASRLATPDASRLAAPDASRLHASDTALGSAANGAAPDDAPPHDISAPRSDAQPTPGVARFGRAAERLRLAEIVLAAGFHTDALRASYESLAALLRSLLDGPTPSEHGGLVAAAYRSLLPSGKAPQGVLATLARLHDLTLLEAHEVPVDPTLVREAVEEARAWLVRLQPRPDASPPGLAPN